MTVDFCKRCEPQKHTVFSFYLHLFNQRAPSSSAFSYSVRLGHTASSAH
jgi:hypothetical protein